MIKVLLTARDRSRKQKNFNKDMISLSLVTHCYVYKPIIIMLMENSLNSLVDSLLQIAHTKRYSTHKINTLRLSSELCEVMVTVADKFALSPLRNLQQRSFVLET